ncbi:MAG: phosphate/phosphite/phosphonate ABC transporter substrate-binding protein [Pedobacter sp.]|nr:phosphate/phosphite/phosphonate ABC transporter substrate-binding protein [Pedobacter sp.]
MCRAASFASGLLLLLLCSWTAGFAHAQDKAATAYSVAVIPVVPPSEIKRRWQPVLDQLGHDTGLHFRFRFYEDFQDFENGLAHDEADFAVMSPLQIWRQRQRYRPQLRGSLLMSGIVVVQKSSPIRQLADLQGRTLSLPDGDNHAANLFVLQTLKEQKITPELRTVKTENNALRSVIIGKADAAIINNYTLKFVPPGMTEQLRIIHQTVDLPPPPIAASLRLPAEDLQKVKAAMLRLQETHPELLQSILMPDIVEADLERDYSIVGKLIPAEAGNGGR